MIITNILRTRATAGNHTQRQWLLVTQAVLTPVSVVSGSLSIHRFCHPDVTRLEGAMARLLELYWWNTRPCINASDMEMVRYATRRVAKALAEAPQW